MVTIFLNVIDADEEKSSQLESLMDSEIYESFVSDKDRKKINIQFKPIMMLDLIAISEVIDLKPAAIVEDVVIRLMTMITSQDERLRSFWESEIKNYLDMFLKAA